jgi:hypothetical protein
MTGRRGAEDVERESGRDDELAGVFERAGRRADVPADDLARIREAARAEWRRLPRRDGGAAAGAADASDRRRRFAPLALAAGLLLAFALAWLVGRDGAVRPDAPPPLVVASAARIARIERLDGEVRLDGERLSGAAIGRRLPAGAVVSTAAAAADAAPGRLSLRIGSGSVRLDGGSRLRLVSFERLELESGAVYVDSSKSAGDGGLVVGTVFGAVREIGTQFEVRLATAPGAALEVRVREGRVTVARPAGPLPVVAGERLLVAGDGSSAREPLAADAASWDWVVASAPTPEIEGRPLRELLDWVGRETGRRLVFDRPATERAADEIVLHGTIEGLRPDQALEAVLAGAGLDHVVEPGTLRVRTPD